MNPRIVLLIPLLVAAFVMAACVSQAPPTSSVPPVTAMTTTMTTVKVAYLPVISNGPLFIAKEEGYFAGQGISVEFEKFQSATTSLPALVNGDIAVSGGMLMPGLVNSVAGGAHVRIVADKGKNARNSCTSTALVVRRDLFENGTVTQASDLKGRKLAASTDQSYGIFRLLALGNLTPDDVEVVSMDYPSSLIALKNKAIDAGVLTEPYITQSVNSGSGIVLIPAQDYYPDFPYVLYYGPAILDKDPDLGRRFMVAYLKGVRQYNEGKTERNLAILHNYTFLDQDLLNQSCWVRIEENGVVSRQPVRDYLDWMYTNKKISRIPDENQLYDMSYVTYASGILGNTTSSG
jgi:NitT/TauT family transport system substrate-binding protein